MKKIILISITFLVIFSFLPFQIYSKNNSYNYFELRYELKHNISEFSFPKKLLKKRYKFYWKDFDINKSNLTWFDPFKIDLSVNKIVLDIKTKFVIQKSLKDIELKDLNIFSICNYDQYLLFNILKLDEESEKIKSKVKEFCNEKQYSFFCDKTCKIMK